MLILFITFLQSYELFTIFAENYKKE